jgi:hypothetical protein
VRRGIELRDAWIPEYIIGCVRVAAGNGLENFGRHCCEFAVLAELPPLLHVNLCQLLLRENLVRGEVCIANCSVDRLPPCLSTALASGNFYNSSYEAISIDRQNARLAEQRDLELSIAEKIITLCFTSNKTALAANTGIKNPHQPKINLAVMRANAA